jgi:hypothetical protein
MTENNRSKQMETCKDRLNYINKIEVYARENKVYDESNEILISMSGEMGFEYVYVYEAIVATIIGRQ